MPELKQRPVKQSNTCLFPFIPQIAKGFLAEICRASLICSMKVRTVMLCITTVDMQWINDFDDCYIRCDISLLFVEFCNFTAQHTTWFVAKYLHSINLTMLKIQARYKNLSKTKDIHIFQMRNVLPSKKTMPYHLSDGTLHRWRQPMCSSSNFSGVWRARPRFLKSPCIFWLVHYADILLWREFYVHMQFWI